MCITKADVDYAVSCLKIACDNLRNKRAKMWTIIQEFDNNGNKGRGNEYPTMIIWESPDTQSMIAYKILTSISGNSSE